MRVPVAVVLLLIWLMIWLFFCRPAFRHNSMLLLLEELASITQLFCPLQDTLQISIRHHKMRSVLAPSGISWMLVAPILEHFTLSLGPRETKREAQEGPRAAQQPPKSSRMPSLGKLLGACCAYLGTLHCRLAVSWPQGKQRRRPKRVQELHNSRPRAPKLMPFLCPA